MKDINTKLITLYHIIENLKLEVLWVDIGIYETNNVQVMEYKELLKLPNEVVTVKLDGDNMYPYKSIVVYDGITFSYLSKEEPSIES